MSSILVIDDEEKLRSLLVRLISAEGYIVTDAPDCQTAMLKLEQTPVDVVLCDVKLPDGNGVDMVETIKTRYPQTEVILMTAYGNVKDGVQAIKNGAFDYLVKGDENERILPLLDQAAAKVKLKKRLQVTGRPTQGRYTFEQVIGRSASLQQALQLARKVAATNAGVLLAGETGTGKEVFASAIHNGGVQSAMPFVALNCAAFSRDIIESELFGHRQGAFTGAIKDKKGLVEEASGGTLFLDEIGELPMDVQAKLLRLLETGDYFCLGDTKARKASFRLIAASNKDLKKESAEMKFRQDLYFRLNVFEIKLPPLRDRVEDIEELAAHFVAVFSQKHQVKPGAMTPEFTHALRNYKWPGNIRELRNVMERCVILAGDQPLTTELLPLDFFSPSVVPGNVEAFAMSDVEKRHIQKVLTYTRGNKAEAARLLEIGIATLYRKLEGYGIH
jgi:DNA-binding NtrC family response regulator